MKICQNCESEELISVGYDGLKCAECGELQDGELPDEEEIADQKLKARDYEAWSRT